MPPALRSNGRMQALQKQLKMAMIAEGVIPTFRCQCRVWLVKSLTSIQGLLIMMSFMPVTMDILPQYIVNSLCSMNTYFRSHIKNFLRAVSTTYTEQKNKKIK